MDFLDNLDPLLKTFWFIAIPASIVFLIQTIMTFIGVDSAEGLEADFDSNLDGGDEPFQLFSLRNLVNFLLGFSWTGISFYNILTNHAVLIIVSLTVGAAFVYMFFLIIRQVSRLAENNSFKLTNTLNKTAEVYLAIPERKSGKGKIQISVNGAYHELDAMTENEKIPSGAVVKVVRIENQNMLIVEKV